MQTFIEELPLMANTRETGDLLEALQKAADDHKAILERQSELIRRLREELKDVRPS